MDPLSASVGAVPQVPRQKTAVDRTSSTLDKLQTVRGGLMNSTSFSGFTTRRLQSQVVPESPADKRARESSVSRATAVNEFILFLKIMDEVAIHHITLYFININTLAVILKMEQSFAKYYASSQRKLYLRGLLTLIGFMISTFVYDYIVLWEDYSVGTNATADGVVSTKVPKFTVVVVLKLAVVLPLLFLTFFRARKHPYHEDFKLTWICIFVVACYPVVYNKITNDYGVSWVCLVIISLFRENIFDIVEDIDANGDPGNDENFVFSATIMTLPKGLTRTEVLFRVHGNRSGFRSLTKEAYEFEESYRVENRARWLRFLRLSVAVFLVLKPFLTLYQTIRLSTIRSFGESQLIFFLNFCIMYPVMVAFLLQSFSPNFSHWEQVASVVVISVVAVILCTESLLTNSLGHAYMSALALYQCYFANVSFLLRVINGFEILALYLLANLLIAPYLGWEINATQLRVLRNALYIFMFFASQAWVVFNSEFKQRINHYRDITLNSQKQKLVEEEARITKLLLNLLPETIVHKLKEDPQTTIADFFDNVTVLFTDMVNFTAYSSKVSAMELVQFLNDMYTRFDTIAEREVLYKVEIIGDAYFVVGGCPIVNTNNALAVVTAATDMFAALPLLRRNCGVPDLNIRIGVHSGPVLAGVVGSKDPRYHLFGDTVSIAHFLESSGVPGRIHISESTWASMNKETPGHGFKVEYHTLLSVNGSSKKLRTYFVL
ncbi:hypothetical protein JG688_00003888 [Phytophthora aleatoria]|nr:hypothetical protein JG688_00003888 [Phytophthora aleatoria]